MAGYENGGWIKLHRKVLSSPISSRPEWAWLWVVLLLLANHDEGEKFIWNGKVIELRKGQFVTGRKKLKELTGISETTIERILTFLEKEQQIGQQKTTKYRTITILNWDKYQIADNKRTTNGQQTDTFKKYKNDKKDTPSGEGSTQYDPLGAEILKAFTSIDPKNGTYYSNTTQRKACDFLIKEYGLDKVMMAVKILPKINAQKLYVQQITTPYELMNNWVKLGNAVKKGAKLKENVMW